MVRLSILSSDFYQRDTVKVAKELLGKALVRVIGKDQIVGKIVEVEAYRGLDDPASHAFSGLTPRNSPMFGQPGHAYIYFTYGNHYCLNVTTEPVGVPGAVLIRAIEPVEGVEVMKRYRHVTATVELANGPGKLTKALHIDKSLNGIDLTKHGQLFVRRAKPERVEVACSIRVGIRKGTHLPWRFYIPGNPYVS